MADQPELWGVKKTLKVLVPLTVVGLLVVIAFIPHDKRLKVSAARGGECIEVPVEAVTRVLREKDNCGMLHNGEIYAAFEYPADADLTADSPTPEENCRLQPEGMTPEQVRAWEAVMAAIDDPAVDTRLITNNADDTVKRDYVCVVVFPEREGSYLQEVVVNALQTTGG